MTSARPGDVTAHLGEDVTFSSINASHSTGFLDYLFHFSFLFFFLFLVGGRGRGGGYISDTEENDGDFWNSFRCRKEQLRITAQRHWPQLNGKFRGGFAFLPPGAS